MRLRKMLSSLGLVLLPALLYAQTTPVTLAFDYPVSEESNIDHFVLQRRLASGNYADLTTVAKTLRVATDNSAVLGTVYCYRMFAEKTVTPNTFRSTPSNEVCAAVITAVTNLRLQ